HREVCWNRPRTARRRSQLEASRGHSWRMAMRSLSGVCAASLAALSELGNAAAVLKQRPKCEAWEAQNASRVDAFIALSRPAKHKVQSQVNKKVCVFRAANGSEETC